MTNAPKPDHSASWSDFWADQQQGQSSGCLPGGWRGIDTAQQRVWQGFAGELADKARVLDLATGDGRVMGWLLEAKPGLKLTGTDLAPKLPPPPAGTKLRTGVPMEELPFDDGYFSAACSQFGFEYGDIAKTSAELARVVRPGGKIGLLMHRGDGPILAHNLARREQINWAIEANDLIDIAKKNLKAQALGLVALPAKLQQAPAEGARQFGQGSAAWEIAEAIRQTMVLGRRDDPAKVAGLLDTIVAKARNELGRIASLEAACATADSDDALIAAFKASGLKQIEASPVAESSESPAFATFRVLERSA